MNPVEQCDGIMDVKNVTGYSIEKRLDDRRFFLEEGTFNFWNPAAPTDTIIGRILEIAPEWSIGYVSPALIGKYRTFDSYDDYLLSFIYNTAPDKFRCVFVFDPYEKTIDVYDADEQRPVMPIYLSFENLLESIEVEELSDELVTALRPYGADELDVRNVNPIGTNWLYDLSYFIENGDISGSLAQKWNTWQRAILNRQEYYKGLIGLRASATAELLSMQAALTDLNAGLTDLTNQQSITIQALAMETTDAGKQAQQALLDEINAKIEQKKAEIEAKEAEISALQEKISGDSADSYDSQIRAIVNELSITNFFTDDEYATLKQYFIEQDMTEETFVATDLDTAVSGQSYQISSSGLGITGAAISEVDLTEQFGRMMYVMSGGTFSISGETAISCDIIRGTLETGSGDTFVMSLYAGTITVGDKTARSGMITMTGQLGTLSSDIAPVTIDGVTTSEGTEIAISEASCSLYLTANISDYQKYSVQMELYDYAAKTLADLSSPTYEFTVDSGNFIFASEFAPFRNKLELGNAVYLNIGDSKAITPVIIEIEFSFEDRSKFSIVFSNRFKRHDAVNTLKDMIETSYSSGRSFDASKYVYGKSASQMPAVTKFMNGTLDAARNAILGAANQSVVIDGAGIQIGGDSRYQMRIIDNMIAMTDDGWATAKLAIGRFATAETGEQWGVNAELIAGKLIIGNNMILENETDDGVMQFKVDASGAWLNNSTFLLQKGNGGKILIDPKYGIVAGTGDLYSTSGTTVSPSFVSEDGTIELDDDGMPKNANFYLDLKDGNAYFRGRINATSGSIGGWSLGDDCLYSGSNASRVTLNASKTKNAAYAIWAGAEAPESAPFWVKRDGSLYANTGTFKGTVSGAKYQDSNGNMMLDETYKFKSDYLNLLGINVGDGNFTVDASGNVSINGSIKMAAGSTINWASVTETNPEKGSAYKLADSANDTANAASSTASSALNAANGAYSTANGVQTNLALLANGQYQGGTFISGTSIYSPELVGDEIKLANGNSYEVGKISMQVSNTPAFDITSNLSLRLQSAAGWNAYLGNGYAEGSGSVAAVLCGSSGVLNLYGSAIAISSANFGSSLPTTGVAGQIFFKLE